MKPTRLPKLLTMLVASAMAVALPGAAPMSAFEAVDTASESIQSARSASKSGPKQATVPKVYRERTLIAVNGRAQLNGMIEFAIEPEGERVTNLRLDVSAKTKNKRITKELTEELEFVLGDRYKVMLASEKTIRINAKKRGPALCVMLKRNELAGVSVMIGRGR